MIFLPIIVFCFGLIIGSFLNVVILRLNTGRSIATGGSKCARCSAPLKWYELIPVFSFLGLRGKCRSCKTQISFQYPIVELLTALIFTVLYGKIVLAQGFSTHGWVAFVFSAIIASLLIIITIYDFKHKIIPDKIVYPFIVLAFISIIWKVATIPGFSAQHAMFAGILLAAPFFCFWLFSHGRLMGFGDVKLALGIGFLVGITASAAVFVFSFWLGAIIGLILIALSRTHGMKSQIPFAPFMIMALFIVSVLGIGISAFFPLWQ